MLHCCAPATTLKRVHCAVVVHYTLHLRRSWRSSCSAGSSDELRGVRGCGNRCTHAPSVHFAEVRPALTMARPGRPRSADPPAAVLSDADLGIRGRRRSQSFSADDTDMLAEMDAAVGNPSSAPSLPKAASGPGSSGAGQLSDRTLAIIGMRERGSAAAAVAAASSPSRPVTQADREEAALAEEERRAMVASVIRRPVMASSSGRDGKDYSMTVKILLLGDAGAWPVAGAVHLASQRRRLFALSRGSTLRCRPPLRAGVGKTSMMLRYSENTFSINMMATAGCVAAAHLCVACSGAAEQRGTVTPAGTSRHPAPPVATAE